MLIPTSKTVKTITDMREDALGLLKQVEKQGAAYIFYRSKPKAVILNMEDFAAIYELLEDYQDQQEARKLVKEKRGKGVPLEQIAKKYL